MKKRDVLRNLAAAAVFSAYEDYLSENGLKDQNSALADLPEIIENDADMPRANVIIVGFTGLTVQMCRAISALLKRAASVTAVLAGGGVSPAEAAGGIKMLKSIAAPYRHLGIKFMPTGGVTIDNAGDWLAVPEVAAAGGTWLNKADAKGIRKAVALAKSL